MQIGPVYVCVEAVGQPTASMLLCENDRLQTGKALKDTSLRPTFQQSFASSAFAGLTLQLRHRTLLALLTPAIRGHTSRLIDIERRDHK